MIIQNMGSNVPSIVVVSGYFDPVHKGHIEYMRKASMLGTTLIAIVNTDQQAKIKKGYSFMKYKERAEIVGSLKYVDFTYKCKDQDGSVCESLRQIREIFPKSHIIFAKGGDRTRSNIPEAMICKVLGIDIRDHLGKKIQSSSDLVKRYNKWNKN